MKLLILTAAAAAAITWAAPAGASGTHGLTKHDRQVIRFFQHHPRAAATPAGGRILSRILPRVTRSLQAADRAAMIPTTWKASTDLVGRYFGANTAAWEMSCSSSEGGWGGWVPNSRGSGAGGWLQFMSGTFYGIIDKAIANARSRGMNIPDSARSWYSPYGQAIAGAQMLLDGRIGEWSGANC